MFLDFPNFDDMVFFGEHAPTQDISLSHCHHSGLDDQDDVIDMLSDFDIYSESTSNEEGNM